MTELRELSSSELIYVRELARSASHPRRIDEYLQSRGYSEDEIDDVLYSLDISPAEIQRAYRAKQRCVACAVIAALSTIAASLIAGFGMGLLTSLAMVGIAILAFMGLMISMRPLRRRNREQKNSGWLNRRRFTPR